MLVTGRDSLAPSPLTEETAVRSLLSLCAILFMTGASLAQVEAIGTAEGTALLDTSCRASEQMAAMLGATGADPVTARDTMCGCLVEVLGPQITFADAEMLASELSGTLTNEARTGYANTEHLGEIAEAAFGQCQQSTGLVTVD